MRSRSAAARPRTSRRCRTRTPRRGSARSSSCSAPRRYAAESARSGGRQGRAGTAGSPGPAPRRKSTCACILTSEMRALVTGVLVVTLAGCGGSETRPAKKPAPAQPQAAEVVYLYRVQGDDPMPYSVSLRSDGTAQVIRGGGHGGFKKIAVVLDPGDAKSSARLAERAPFKRLDGLTVRPGGFGGWDNDIRYMIRRGNRSVTVTADHMPR